MATLYTDFKNGLDANPGTSGSPKKTLNGALLAAGNGDTILVRGGSANDEVYYERSLSTALNNLTIRPDTGHAPIFTPSDVYTSWALTSGDVYETAYTQSVAVFVYNGSQRLTSTGSIVACQALPNSYFFDNPGNLLHVNIGGPAPTRINAGRNTAEVCTFTGTNTTIASIVVQWACQAWILDSCDLQQLLCRYLVGGATNNRVIRNNGANSSMSAIAIEVDGGSYDAWILNSATSTDATIDGFLLTGPYTSSSGDGVEFAGGTGHIAINGFITGSNEGAIRVRNATVECENVEVKNQGRIAFYADTGSTLTCIRCWTYLDVNTAQPETWGFVADEDTTPANLTCYHCTAANLERNLTPNPAVFTMAGFGINTSGVVIFKNCIAYKCDRGFGDTLSFTATRTEDYNCANQNSVNNWVGFSAGANSITSDPLFVDEGNDDYRLQAGSPCIDTGILIPGVDDDYDGLAPDMGYWEYPDFFLLTVTLSGSGTVVSSPAGINCSGDCTELYEEDTVVTLTATPATGYRFVGWLGDYDSAINDTATVAMDATKQITAVFELKVIPRSAAQGLQKSQNWCVFLPLKLGPFDRFLPLRAGDLENIRDSSSVTPTPIFARDLNSGQRREIARTMDEAAGVLGLTVTELAADRLDLMRAIGCPFPVQRKACCAGDPGRYEHYSAVQLGERSLANPTATGPDKQDATPTVSFPGVYGRRFELTDGMPFLHPLPDDLTPVGLAYCYNALCTNCLHPCDKLYLLAQEQIDESTTQLTLHTSEDGGWNWDGLNIPQMREAGGFLFCHQGGRLFIGDADGVYYSDDPEAEEWLWVATLDAVGIRKMVSDGETIFGINDTNEIWRSTDEGLTWQQVVAEDTVTTGTVRDIAIAGKVVATVGEDGGGVCEILYSLHGGDYQTWQSYTDGSLPTYCAIGLANPNPFDKSRFWIYLTGHNAGSGTAELWKAEGLAGWKLLNQELFDPILANGSQIFLDGDGYIGWFHVVDAADNTVYTLRTSDGGKTLVNVSHEEETVVTADSFGAMLAVCPLDPDTALLAATSNV